MVPMMLPTVQLSVSEDLQQAVSEAAERGIGALKVVIDPKRPRLVPEAEVHAEDELVECFEKVLGSLKDDKPCLVLLRLRKDLPEFEVDWLLISWTPEDAPPREKMRYACCKKTVRDKFKGLEFREFFAEDRASLTFEAVLASCRPMSEEERDALSTREERTAKLIEQERADRQPVSLGPRIDYGLRAPQVQALPSFDQALNSLLAEAGQRVIRAQLEVVEGAHGARDGRELTGTVLPDVSLSNGASGCDWLSADEACYVLSGLRDDRLLLLIWRPEGSDPTDKVLYSSSRAAVRTLVERAAENRDVVVVEAQDMEELGECLRNIGVESG